jgi:hypothetical protein
MGWRNGAGIAWQTAPEDLCDLEDVDLTPAAANRRPALSPPVFVPPMYVAD